MAYSHDHGGHRERMRRKYLENGIDIFSEHEALEILLYYAIPQKDTNALAHKLLKSFGSFSAVFDASPGLLKQFGLTEYQITLLKLMPDLARLYLIDHNKVKPIETSNLCFYFTDKFVGRTSEVMYLLLLDSKDKELYSGVISKGSVNSTDVPIKRIVTLALSYNARAVAVAHNHPGGVALPSQMDMITTNRIYNALQTVGISLIDHVIVAEDDAISLANSLYGRSIFTTKDD